MMANEDVESICAQCKNKCYGDVVHVYGKTYHHKCFTCNVSSCTQNLVDEGYLYIDGVFYCQFDFRKLLGKTCVRCEAFIEGNGIEVGGLLYHLTCFNCVYCGVIFPPNTEVCFDGERFSCVYCFTKSSTKVSNDAHSVSENTIINNDKFDTCSETSSHGNGPGRKMDRYLSSCSGCGEEIKNQHSLTALERQWHIRCFTCFKCGVLLVGEYIGKDGIPYCEKDYQKEFGISCAKCNAYISGKVLQAGGKYYHPSCSRCCKCDEIFCEGEEMFVQGTDIWHPKCSDDNKEVLPQERANDSMNTTLSESLGQDSGGHDRELKENNIEIDSKFDNPPQTLTLNNLNPQVGDTKGGEVSVPPPPQRASSKQWHQKYISCVKSGTYSNAPKENTRPHSYAASEFHLSSEIRNGVESCLDTNSLHPLTSSNMDCNKDTTAISQKGIGFNKLQYRRSIRESQRANNKNMSR